MSKLLSAASSKGHQRVHELLKAGGPILIEVRLPGGAVPSHWYLCDTEDDFDNLLVQLNADAVMHVSRVWDLTNRAGAVVLRR